MRSVLLPTLLLLALAAPAARAQGEPVPANPKPDPESQPYSLADEAEEGEATEPERPSFVGTIVQIVLSLVGIVVLIVGIGWLARRFVPGAPGAGGSGPVRVVARTAIAPKVHVYLVQIGKRILVLGYTGDSIRTLAEIVEPGEVASLIAASASGSGHAGFGAFFRRSVADYGASGEKEGDLDVDKVREELKRLSE